MNRRASLTIFAIFFACVPSAGRANDRKDELPDDLLTIMRNNQPSFMVRVELDRKSCAYRKGDSVKIRVASEQDAYLYVFYQPAEGKTYQIFPNRHQPNNFVKARQAVQIPAERDLFQWVVVPPFGKENIKVVATRKKIEKLSAPEYTSRRFNPITQAVLKGIELELGEEKPTEWAEDDVVIYTHGNEAFPSESRRFAVFFGVSKHRFAKHFREARKRFPDDQVLNLPESKDPTFETGGDLFASHRDAQKLAAAMNELGQLQAMRILTNDRATKRNMQEAITEWLPNVSRPGDTVFIYFSGHTGQIPDNSGDEPDKQDEYMVPHDMFGLKEWYSCRKLLEIQKQLLNEGVFTPRDIQEMQLAVKVGQDAFNKHGKQTGLFLTQQTTVTDDLMAHWLQRLSDRQIVFISDSCHSAGFAKEETRARDNGRSRTSDLMQSEVRRLNELGQENEALLCSALTNEIASELDDKSMGVMSSFLVAVMQDSAKAVSIENAFKFCEVNMEKYFAQRSADRERLRNEGKIPKDTPPITASHPFLINNCRLPIFLKP